jgi:two-component system sensor histidine kinase UhpB
VENQQVFFSLLFDAERPLRVYIPASFVHDLQADTAMRLLRTFERMPSELPFGELPEKGYQLLIEHLPAICYIAAWDVESSTLYVSQQIQSILGFTQKEWMADATLWLKQIHPDDRASVLVELERLHAGGQPVPSEYRMLTRDGQVVWFRDEVAIGYGTDDRPLYLYGVMLDITERKRVEAELADVRRRLTDRQEAERLRFAHDLHDDVIQQLHGIGYLIDNSLQRLMSAGEGDALAVVHAVALERIRREVQDVATQVRGVIGELRPAGLDELGLAAALEAEVQRLSSVSGPGLPTIALDLYPYDHGLSRSNALCLFRAAQEALRNALQHAQADHIDIHLRFEPTPMLSVHDDGVGLPEPVNLNAFALTGHFGLAGIAERVEAAGGQLIIDTHPGAGTSITVRLPGDDHV